MKLGSSDVVVVTGVASGMGRAYALAFAGMGCRLALCDIDQEGLAQTSRLVAAVSTAELLSEYVDVTDPVAVSAFAQKTAEKLGRARIVINNAGIEGSAQPSWRTSLPTYQNVMAVNYFGVVHGCQAFLPHLLSHKQSWLVNVSSVFGLIGTPNHTDYCASKFAVRGYSEALRAELEGSGVHVMLVHPGGVKTKIARQEFSQTFARHYLRSTPEEIVDKVLRAMAKKRARVVCGHNSWKTALASRWIPLGLLSRLIWRELSEFIDTRHYPARKACSEETEREPQ